MSIQEHRKWKLRLGMGLLLVAALALVAGAGVEIVAYFDQVTPNEAEWAGLGQADAEAEAFVYWDGDDEISTRCAKCHNTLGHLDFLGVKGTDANAVDNAAAPGMTGVYRLA